MTVLMKVDGVGLVGFPLVRRLVVDDVQAFDYQKATGGGDIALPTNQIAALAALLVRTLDQPATVKLGNIVVNAGGIVIVFDAAPTTSTIANASGSPTTVQGLGGGT